MNLYVRKLILILWVVAIATDISNGCPVQCSCHSTTNGKEVFCKFSASIPLNLGLPNDTYLLNVHSSSLPKIDDTDFSNLGNLTILRMDYNGIFVISDNAFRYSRNLQILRMDDNKLLYLQGKLFVHNDQLINLDFRSNAISTIEVEVFGRLVNLETLLLNNNKISSLDKRLFSNLTNLKTLSISNNLITTIEDNTFINLINIESLNIFDNRKMNRLTAFIFQNLTEVTVIDLKQCVIETIEANAFFNITGPLVLTIRRNRIFHIEVNAFGELPELFFLSVLSNTLICDCRIRSFRLWILQQTSTIVDGAICSEQNGQLIKDIVNVEECKETTTEIESSTITSESAETTQTIVITKTNNNVNQASSNISNLLGIIACTVSAMAFITIIIYIVIKTRCSNRSSVHKQNKTGKQEEIVGYDLAETPNCYSSEYDLPQEVIIN
ncbi:uncharacterized protein LOC143073305 isoform X4 [Mytilus galloprovincialis]|uniref:uncharacterized protein LOC143073305 isoform X4 n=1 Tax=Mytilus galloprovincialis TaxID=29158 RepID=UPI003F7B9339